MVTITSVRVIFDFFRNSYSRETPDLLYDDIGSPFTDMKSGECAKDGKSEFSIALHLGSGS